MTKNNSLIGIAELIIPYLNIINKKIEFFEKKCQVIMTDSIKRIIFGSKKQQNIILTINVKINYNTNEKLDSTKTLTSSNIHTEINTEQNNISLSPKAKNYSKKITIGKKNPKTPSYNNGKVIEGKKNYSEKYRKINNNSYSINNDNKEIKNNSYSINKDNKNIQNNSYLNKDIDFEKEYPEEDIFNKSLINNDIENEIEETEKEFSDYINNYINENPLSNLNNINDLNSMIQQTKQVLDNFMAYQNLFYQQIKNSVNLNNKFYDLLKLYHEKFNYINKKKYFLEKKLNKEQFNNYIIVNVNRKNNKNIKKITPFKEKEIDLFKDFLEPFNNISLINNENKINNKEEEKEILLKTLRNIISQLNDINIILNNSDLKESEKTKIKNLLIKYNLISSKEIINELSEDEEDKFPNNEIPKKFEYVITSKIDDIDIKLEQYLKYFYSKRKLPKIVFTKISTYNYEYGTQKIMVKLEKDNIRIRHIGGYSSLDQFIVNNAVNEDNKLKKSSSRKKPNKK